MMLHTSGNNAVMNSAPMFFFSPSCFCVVFSNAGEKEVDENDPCIYAMENKTAWRIDGGKWKDVCSLSGCLIVISDIVTDRLHTYIKHHPSSKSKMQSVKKISQ